MFSPHVSNIRRASTTIDSVSERRFLIIERIDFSPEFALYQYLHCFFFYIGPTGGTMFPGTYHVPRFTANMLDVVMHWNPV